jgi:hypothetical protein
MRISHRELELCRHEFRAWAQARRTPSFPRWGYNRATVLGIYHYHKRGDKGIAVKYLRTLMRKVHLENRARCQRAEDQLLAYITWHENSRVIAVDSQVRISMVLGTEVVMGGEISRVDILPSTQRYRVVLFGDFAVTWKSELRMPLLQAAAALRYERPIPELSVAVQRLDGSGLEEAAYSNREINSARDEARTLARRIRRSFSK